MQEYFECRQARRQGQVSSNCWKDAEKTGPEYRYQLWTHSKPSIKLKLIE